MPKRKHDDYTGGSGRKAARHSSGARGSKGIEEQILHGKKELHRAIKLAKGFERQKLGRRHKLASQEKDENAMNRIDAEIEALKTLDISWTADNHLSRTLLKQKAIAESPKLPQNILAIEKREQTAAVANVTARLYNSNPVKAVVAESLSAVRSILGLDARSVISGKKSKTQRAKQPDSAKVFSTYSDDNESVMSENPPVKLEDTHRQSSVSESAESIASGAVDEDFMDLDGQIANSSEDLLSEDDSTDPRNDLNSTQGRKKYAEDILDELSSSSSHSPSHGPPKPMEVEIPAKAATKTHLAKPSFLPSLTMGGYWSGSEGEDISDVEVAPRKNRRGQRARQKIWEQKYGGKAKHLRKQQKGEGNGKQDQRDQGWDLKRGAQEEGLTTKGRSRPAWMRPRAGESQNIASGGNATELKPRAGRNIGTKQANQALHPSWEAAKKAKERRNDISSFAGKKVVFD